MRQVSKDRAKRKQKILNWLKKNPNKTATQVSERFDYGRPIIAEYLDDFKKDELVTFTRGENSRKVYTACSPCLYTPRLVITTPWRQLDMADA